MWWILTKTSNRYSLAIFCLIILQLSPIFGQVSQSQTSDPFDLDNLSLKYRSPRIIFSCLNGTINSEPPQAEVYFFLNFTENAGYTILNLTLEIIANSSGESLYYKSNDYRFNKTTYGISYLDGSEVGIMPFTLPKIQMSIEELVIFSRYKNQSNSAPYEGYIDWRVEIEEDVWMHSDSFSLGYSSTWYYYAGGGLQEATGYSKFVYEENTHFLLAGGQVLLYTEFIKGEYGEFSTTMTMYNEQFNLEYTNYPMPYWTPSPLQVFWGNYGNFIKFSLIGLGIISIIVIGQKVSKRGNR
ncbi:MAG: hypothetical protein ACTSRK_20575 [Promethearchaeota archaeon]